MRLERTLGLIALVLLAACSAELKVPPDARITCSPGEKCPGDLVCLNGRCVASAGADTVPPELKVAPVVTPTVGRAGVTFTVRLVTTEPLSGPAVLTLDLAAPLDVECVAEDPVHHACQWTATGLENGGLGGPVAFDVRLADAANNSVVRRRAGALLLDFTAPSLAAKSVEPQVARLGSTLQIFFASSEPLDGGRATLLSSASLATDGGAQSTFELLPEGSTLNYRFTHRVGPADPPGPLSFRVAMEDVAGNAALLDVGQTTLDPTLPALVAVADGGVKPAFARDGTQVEVSFAVSKALAGDPRVTVGGLSMQRDPAVAPPAYRYTRTAAADGGTEGLKAVVIEAEDPAGNSLVASPGAVTFDFTPPFLVSTTVNPLVAKLGDSVSYSINANEPLAARPVLDAGALAFAWTSGTEYLFEHLVTAADSAEVVAVGIDLEDRAGNTARGLPGKGFTVDNTLPALDGGAVSPAFARDSTLVAVAFGVTKPLAGDPRVTVGGLPMQKDPAVTAPSYRFTLTARADGGTEGLKAVLIEARDLAGNSLVDSPGAVTFDFTPPFLVSTNVSPSSAKLGDAIAYTVNASEPLLLPPLLDAGVLAFAWKSGTEYLYEHGVTPADPNGVTPVALTLVDRAGNQAAGLSGSPVSIDSSRPVVTNVVVSPDRINETGLLDVSFDVSEPLPDGGLSVAVDLGASDGGAAGSFSCGAFSASSPSYRCARAMVGDELPAQTEAARTVVIQAVDAAGNRGTGSATVVFDFKDPSVGSAFVTYAPGPANPLGTVTAATDTTTIVATVVSDEALAPGTSPTLVASNGTARLCFRLASAGDAGAAANTFVAVLPADSCGAGPLVDGTYVPTLALTDVSGNSTSDAGFATPSIVVKRARPTLVVDQNLVTWLRSPWGNAAAESLDGGFTLPSGAYFALAPADPLSAEQTLAASTFSLAGGALPTLVRAWADDAGSAYLGALGPLDGGAWPRKRLANLDTPTLYVTGVDEAGNESPGVRVVNAEWVATPNPPGFASSPHRVERTTFAVPTLTPEAAFTRPAGLGLEGLGAPRVSVASEFAWRERPSPAGPGSRDGHSIAYDSQRGRTVLFGGTEGSVRNDVWEWDGSRWYGPFTPANRPSPRSGAPMVFDSVRGRTVLVGGPGLDDVWEWDGTSWAGPFRPTLRPLNVEGPVAVAFDSWRGRVVLFGGDNNSSLEPPKVWEWDGSLWSVVVGPTGSSTWPSSKRAYDGMAFDAKRGRIVMIAGQPNSCCWGDIWEWDGAAWTGPLGGFAPPLNRGKRNHALVYDSNHQRVVLFGGFDNISGGSSAVWEWDGAAWTGPLQPVKRPSPRGGPAAWDSARGRMVSFGGDGTRELWEWDGAAWTGPITPGAQPSPRFAHAMAYDANRSKTVLFGGFDGADHSVWEWDGFAWRGPLATPPPPSSVPAGGAQGQAPMVYDPVRRVVVLFGRDVDWVTPTNSVWEWNGTSWTGPLRPAVRPPLRIGSNLVYDVARSKVVLFGGWLPGPPDTFYDDVWEWDGTTWTGPLTPSPRPSLRMASAMAYDPVRQVSVVFGGNVFFPYVSFNDVWEWNGTAWTGPLAPTPRPDTRTSMGGTMAWDPTRGRAVLFGGPGGGARSDLWEWNGSAWAGSYEPTVMPPGRMHLGQTYDTGRDRLILFGGRDTASRDDLWERDVTPSRQPAVQFTASVAPAGLGASAASAITGLRVRAACGGQFSPYGAGDVGATLNAWSTGGGLLKPGQWVPVASNSAAPAAPGLITWSAASDAEARRFLIERDQTISVQCRPSGGTGTSLAQAATLGVDYVEVRVRYLTP